MPAVVRLGAIKIQVFSGDHNPPHFHVKTADQRAKLRLETLDILRGKLDGPDHRTVIEWAEKNRLRLWAAWESLNGK